MSAQVSGSAETIEEYQFDGRTCELVLLHSMYPGQLDLDDDQLQLAIQREDVAAKCPQTVTGLFLVDKALEVYFVLPSGYPEDARPTVYCRIVDGSLGRKIQKQMNDEITEAYTAKDDASLIEILQAIVHLWDERRRLEATATANCQVNEPPKDTDDNEVCRYWIYSHHIKSKTKRKLILALCEQLQLTGVMLIGKPGFICIEGSRRCCDSWWSQIRILTWQRISHIDTEILSPDNCRSFENFEEHSDRSAVFRLLQAKGCDTVLKNFLGIFPKSEASVK